MTILQDEFSNFLCRLSVFVGMNKKGILFLCKPAKEKAVEKEKIRFYKNCLDFYSNINYIKGVFCEYSETLNVF
ncbi:hypothetical protein KL86CLO1_10681 [uncultured Eubacteriales bacterium]|uniref:Uncharacterized protein n=1 Tax=uncultured Eubacteriales bacterium TaxID=172733 RepID=A0A212J8B8_9FIRM|nr:hypothetical protein KL86CLO1_10681 [uncultured Eubacteriales bacterium]